MKKGLSILLAVITVLTLTSIIPANASQHIPIGFEEKQIDTYAMNKNTDPETITCLFRDDLPTVPYLSPEDFLNHILTVNVGVSNNGDGVFTYTNGEYHMVVDTVNDIVSFDRYEAFTIQNLFSDYAGDQENYYEIDPASFDYQTRSVRLDLGNYGIDIVTDGKRAYLPYVTLNDIFAETYCGVVFKSNRFRFVNTYLRYIGETDFAKYSDSRDKAMAQFTYDELCFVTDNFYGKPSKAILSDSIRKKGLDRTLSEYSSATSRVKELLLSESTEEYCAGVKLLDYYLDDGGHTSLGYALKKVSARFGLTDAAAAAKRAFGDSEAEELKNIETATAAKQAKAEAKSKLWAQKYAAYAEFETIRTWGKITFSRAGDTYFFDFDSFDSTVAEPFKQAMDYAEEHHAKRFIIDLSTNGGGTTTVAAFMLSLMHVDHNFLARCEASSNTYPLLLKIDKNLDGVIDEKDDEVQYSFDCAILTSQYSFSCANLMPCFAQDNGVAILGETSGGGCCDISVHYYPDGSLYAISGSTVMLRKSGADVDGGAVPDASLPGAASDYDGFYDIDAINAGFDAYYATSGTVLCGDYDEDRSVTILDATRAQNIIAELMERPSEDFLKKVDADGDGDLTILDATSVQRYLADLPAYEGIGKPAA